MSRSRINEALDLVHRIRGYDTNALAEEIDTRTRRLAELGWPTDETTFSLDREVLELLRITAGKIYQIGMGARTATGGEK